MKLHEISPSRRPTSEEIEKVLQLWRPTNLRCKAHRMHLSDSIPVLLRTHSSSNLESAETMKASIDEET